MKKCAKESGHYPLLNDMGVIISKRQVVRLLTAKLATFRAEDEAVLKAGLSGAYVTVDDTGARHAGRNCYTTQIGSPRFTTFRTGVVGIIHGKGGHNRRIGLQADMDALPIQEVTGLGHASQNDGVMHACGHDGHTTMLLGAAQYLAEKRNFKGSVVLIFQPAEEGLGGARKMLAEGLFKRFPCDEIYGLHNKPDGNRGKFGLRKGPMMAGASFFDVIVRGKGGHAAMPDKSKDVIYIATSLVQHLQSVVSRSVAPDDPCVLSVTKISAGSAYNVLPDAARLCGTLRYFSREVRDLAQSRVESICIGFAAAHEVCIDIQFRETADVLINSVAPADALLAAACEILGTGHVHDNERLTGGAEDFADMLRAVPGAYGWLSHAGTMPLHSPAYVFDEEVLPLGASILAHVAERQVA